MKTLNQFIICLLLMSYSSLSLAQKCKTNELRKQHILQNTEIQNNINEIHEFTEKWIEDNKNAVQFRSVETVSVVVHVLWKDTEENITDEQIISQIDVLNEDYRKLNENASTTPTPFKAIAADVEIEFCLATTDPDGNPTNGITRTKTAVNEIGNTEAWYSTVEGGIDPWDNTKYINIWVCSLGDDGLLGFATPPGTADPIESDGMVIGSQFFGTTGSAANSAPNHLGRTATHEMGHYFNLEHLWGQDGGCDDDDFVDDTPLQDVESGGCPTFPLTDNCTAGDGINFNNFLDYSDDDCMTMFTEGQKMRMLATLNGPRASLLTSNACSGTVSNHNMELKKSVISVFPNPSSEFITIRSNDFNNFESLFFQIVDVLGTTQRSFTLTQTKTIDVSNMAKGVYFLYCKQSQKTIKLIINK